MVKVRWRNPQLRTWSLATCLMLMVGAAALFIPTSAANAESVYKCQIVVGKAPAPGAVSPVLSSACGEADDLPTPAADVLIMRWWDGRNYGGFQTDVLGSGGPCDEAGYGISYVGNQWNDRILSYKVYNQCNYSSEFTDSEWRGVCWTQYGAEPSAHLPSSMWVARGSFAWDVCNK